MANKTLTKAKAAKKDEFYTQFYDIETEMEAYLDYKRDVFRDKTVLLPCDDPYETNGESNTTSVPTAKRNSPSSRWRATTSPLGAKVAEP